MSDVAYITNAAATLAFTAGSKTVTVTGTNPILEGVLRGDRAPDPNGMELAIDAVAAGSLTLLRNAPTSGTVQFDVAPVSRLRTSLAANAEVTREVYARQQAAAEDNRSINVISLATAPPGSPADGDRHLVIATATGAFAGKEGYIAQYDSANVRWIFIAPIAGMKVTVDGSAVIRVYTGSAWAIAPPISSVTTVGRLARFTDTAGGLGQSQMSEDVSGNVTVAGDLTVSRSNSGGAVFHSIYNTATGAAVFARLFLQTGTANSTLNFQIGDNGGSPYVAELSGSAITAKYTDYATHIWRSQVGVDWAQLNSTALSLNRKLSLTGAEGEQFEIVGVTKTWRLNVAAGSGELYFRNLTDDRYPLTIDQAAPTYSMRIQSAAVTLNLPLALKPYTLGTLPSAAAHSGETVRVTDGASNKQIVTSDGSVWRYSDGVSV